MTQTVTHEIAIFSIVPPVGIWGQSLGLGQTEGGGIMGFRCLTFEVDDPELIPSHLFTQI